MNTDSQHDFQCLVVPLPDAWKRIAGAQNLDIRAGQIDTGGVQPRQNQRAAGPRLGDRLIAADDQRSRRHISIAVGHRDFESRRGRISFRPADLDSIRTSLRQLHVRKIGIHVGRQVMGRIADLVDELLGHGFGRNQAPGRGCFGDDDLSRLRNLGDRVTQIVERKPRRPTGKHASTDLRTALDEMPGHGGSGQPVPIGPVPAEFVDRGADRQRSIRNATGDDDSCPLRQAHHDAACPEVGVGAGDLWARIAQRQSGIEIRERLARADEFVDPREKIVSRTRRYRDLSQTRLGENRRGLAGARLRGHAAGIRDDFQLRLCRQRGNQRFEDGEKIRDETGLRIARALVGQNRQRQFGEVFERQVIELSPFCEESRRVQVVAPETGTVTNADD